MDTWVTSILATVNDAAMNMAVWNTLRNKLETNWDKKSYAACELVSGLRIYIYKCKMNGENRSEQRKKLAHKATEISGYDWPFRIFQVEVGEAKHLCPHINQSLAVDSALECEHNLVHGSSLQPRATTSKGHDCESSEVPWWLITITHYVWWWRRWWWCWWWFKKKNC